MAATVRDPQHVRMESGESFPGSWTADGEGICLGDEEFLVLRRNDDRRAKKYTEIQQGSG